MQSQPFEPTALPDLPAQGLIDHWILSSPLPLTLSSIAIGILIFGILRHTKHCRRIGIPSLIIGLVIGVSISLAGALTTTDHETLDARSRQLVQAAAIADQAALESLLADQVRVQTSFVSKTGKSRIIALAQTRAAPLIESVTVREVRAGLFGPQVARTQIKIKVNADLIPPMSWWAIDWTRPSPDSDNWVVTHIESVWIQGIPNPAGSP